jgi:hypothetical protein
MRTDMEKLIGTFLQISTVNARKLIIKSQTCGVQIFAIRQRLLAGGLHSLIAYLILLHDVEKTLIDRPSCYSNKLLIIHAFASVSILMHTFPLIKNRLHCSASSHGG